MARALLLAVALLASHADAYSFRLSPTSPAVAAASPSRASEVMMGRGDRRTKKGKRKAKSFGVWRPTNAALRIRRDGAGENLGLARAYEEEPEPVA
eukprot:7143171-Prymnesium_polylepis.1